MGSEPMTFTLLYLDHRQKINILGQLMILTLEIPDSNLVISIFDWNEAKGAVNGECFLISAKQLVRREVQLLEWKYFRKIRELISCFLHNKRSKRMLLYVVKISPKGSKDVRPFHCLSRQRSTKFHDGNLKKLKYCNTDRRNPEVILRSSHIYLSRSNTFCYSLLANFNIGSACVLCWKLSTLIGYWKSHCYF